MVIREALLHNALGLKWKEVTPEDHTTGREIVNSGLAESLRFKIEFSKEELHRFAVHGLSYDCYINVEGRCFKPDIMSISTTVTNHPTVATGNSDGIGRGRDEEQTLEMDTTAANLTRMCNICDQPILVMCGRQYKRALFLTTERTGIH